jgi:hypothetical protein
MKTKIKSYIWILMFLCMGATQTLAETNPDVIVQKTAGGQKIEIVDPTSIYIWPSLEL